MTGKFCFKDRIVFPVFHGVNAQEDEVGGAI